MVGLLVQRASTENDTKSLDICQESWRPKILAYPASLESGA